MILLSLKNLQLFLNLPSSKKDRRIKKSFARSLCKKTQHHVDPSMTSINVSLQTISCLPSR